MPLHVWLPRAHPIAPAHVSALMSGVMIKVALYGLMRVLFDWLDAAAAVARRRGAGARRDLRARRHPLRALPARAQAAARAVARSRTSGSSCSGSAPPRSCAPRRAAAGRRSRSPRRCCTRSTTRSSRRCCSSAPARSSAPCTGSSSTGSAACCAACRGPAARSCVGAAAIAGLPPLNGFVSEWLTLQALLHLALTGSVGGGHRRRPRARRARADCGARGPLLRQGRRPRAARRRPGGPPCAHAVEAPWAMRVGVVLLAAWCVVLGVVPGALVGPLVGASARLRAARRRDPARRARAPGGLPTLGMRVASSSLVGRAAIWLRGRRVAAPAPTWACGQRLEPALRWTSAGFTKPVRLVLEALAAARARDRRRRGGRHRAVGHLPRARPAADRGARLRAARGRRARAAPRRRRLQSGRLGVYASTCSASSSRSSRCARLGAARMSVRRRRSPAPSRCVGGVARSRRSCPGSSSGPRRGCKGAAAPRRCSPTASCARLWRKSVVDPEGTGPIYRLAPPSSRPRSRWPACSCRSPGTRRTGRVGHDALVLLGLLALARFALAAAAWDTGSGFALQGASRDLRHRRRRRGAARARARVRGARRLDDRPARHGRRERRRACLERARAGARAARLRCS